MHPTRSEPYMCGRMQSGQSAGSSADYRIVIRQMGHSKNPIRHPRISTPSGESADASDPLGALGVLFNFLGPCLTVFDLPPRIVCHSMRMAICEVRPLLRDMD